MKSKIMIAIFSTLTLMSLNACGKDCPPNRPKSAVPPIHYDGWAKMSYVDVDTGVRKDVQVGLMRNQYDYMGADVVSLPDKLPSEVSIEADLPQTAAAHSWEYVPMIGIDGQAPVMALHDNDSLTTGVNGKIYSTNLTRVGETLSETATSGTFRIEMVPDEPTGVVQSIQVRFQKHSSL